MSYRALGRYGSSLRLELHASDQSAGAVAWLRVLRAGVCGTDLQILSGERPDVAHVLGHEGVGSVISSGDGSAFDQRLPTFAVFNPVDFRQQDSVLGHSYPGIFADAVRVPRSAVVTANPLLPADLGPLVEPLATVLYGWELLAARGPVTDLGIWGGGSAAILAALLAVVRGVRVHVFHRRKRRLQWLARNVYLAPAEFRHIPASAALRFPGLQLDAAFICLPRGPASAGLRQALPLLRDGGSVDLFGGFAVGDKCRILPGIDLGLIRRGNFCGSAALGSVNVVRAAGGPVWVTGHRGTSAAQLGMAQDLLMRYPEVFGSIISHVISLEAGQDFIPAMTHRAPDVEFLKVIVDMTMTEPAREPDLSTSLSQLQ